MLLLQDPGRQAVRRISRQDRDLRLRQHRPVVKLFIDDMHGAAGFFFAGRDHRLMDIMPVHPRPAEFRKKRRMDIQDASAETADDPGTDLLQISRQADDVRLAPSTAFQNGGLEGLVAGKRLAFDDRRLDPMLARRSSA